MKKYVFLSLLILFSFAFFAQSTDLDREYFTYSYVGLPSEPIVNYNQRTYWTNDDAIGIDGYSRVESSASLEIYFEFDGTLVEDFRIDKITHEKKDKDGNVTSTRYTYDVHLNYRSRGRYRVVNNLRNQEHKDKFNSVASYTKAGFKSYTKAQHFYDNNRLTIRDKYSREHLEDMREDVRNYLNNTYGYPIRAGRDYFWILGSKKHPEYTKHHDAFNKVIAAFSKMSYLEPTTNIEKELQPVIAYFKDVIKRYPGSKRKKRKVRYASYYNLAKLYYYLDNVGAMKENAQKLIANDYNKKQGKRLLKQAELLQNKMIVNVVHTRHFDVMLNETNHQGNNETNPNESEDTSESSNDIVAYLITKANDTIQASITEKNRKKIAYTANLKVNDGTGSLTTKNYKAQFCKTLALTNETIYQVIEFEEANTTASASKEKFAKVLFESDKVALYLFKEKELVLKFPNQTKGISTASSGFVFGFNKKLASYAGNCSAVLDKTNAKTYKNNEESLLEFCRDFSGCE